MQILASDMVNQPQIRLNKPIARLHICPGMVRLYGLTCPALAPIMRRIDAMIRTNGGRDLVTALDE
jgi:hypothetical protein